MIREHLEEELDDIDDSRVLKSQPKRFRDQTDQEIERERMRKRNAHLLQIKRRETVKRKVLTLEDGGFDSVAGDQDADGTVESEEGKTHP